jgi:exonuclease SbcC
MRPLALRLKGFRGVRDGLGRDEVTLDLAALVGEAPLVALVGANGRGKTTVMDNLHPFAVMPSRAGADGLGAFSYYEHLCLPQNEKELLWEHDGQRYRSQQVFWLQGSRRRSEAYLSRWDGQAWQPVGLADGTLSDGKLVSYERCVQALLGSPETFFTSAFSPQGRRQLAAYRNAEIKSLLADLLGLERLRRLAAAAAQTQSLLKGGLAGMRQALSALQAEHEALEARGAPLAEAAERVSRLQEVHQASVQSWQAQCIRVANLQAQCEQTPEAERQRSALQERRCRAVDMAERALSTLADSERRERERLAALEERMAARQSAWSSDVDALMLRRDALQRVLAEDAQVARAVRLLPIAQGMALRFGQQLAAADADLQDAAAVAARIDDLRERMQALEREAGQAVLRVEDLKHRLGLVQEVPCAGMALQATCPLLSDARTASALVPDASEAVRRLAAERETVRCALHALQAREGRLAHAAPLRAAAQSRVERIEAHTEALGTLASQQPAMALARESMAEVQSALARLGEMPEAQLPAEADEQRQVEQALQRVAHERALADARRDEELRLVADALAALPPAFDVQSLREAEAASAVARADVEAAEQELHAARVDAQSLAHLRAQAEELARRRTQLAARASDCERGLGWWALLAQCLGNDGIVALAIDDAGPALAGLANELLLACYGPRFTVSIATLLTTAKGDAREGFDLVVHDGETGERKSMGWMSGGERVWVNECLVRAIALYLSQNSGRRYETLFSDEADGALDATRKRMFIAMKREVLRLGGYRQEIFVSQTPELAALADAVINLDLLRAAQST